MVPLRIHSCSRNPVSTTSRRKLCDPFQNPDKIVKKKAEIKIAKIELRDILAKDP